MSASQDMIEGAACAHLWADARREDFETTDLHSDECIALAETMGDADGVWSRELAESIRDDVSDWFQANEGLIETYQELTGRDDSHVGHDFALSRSGHGTGLWDRGAGDVGDKLHKLASVYTFGGIEVTTDADGEVTGLA